MNIALIAHDKKKELMAAFCIAYKGILQNHYLCATATTGSIITEASGLNVHRFPHGQLGEQQIEARVAFNEIDALIFFRDPMSTGSDEAVINSLLKACDMNNIPFATNLASAEILINGIARDDLAWRDLIRK